jgi:hypothetical protein
VTLLDELDMSLAHRVIGETGARALRVMGTQRLSSRVYRVSYACDAEEAARTIIIKRLKRDDGKRSELVAKRWLCSAGLQHIAPELLGMAADESGQCVWHAYQDLPGKPLDGKSTDRDHITASVEQIAELHVRFADHPFLSECRAHGGRRDGSFYSSQVPEAIRALESIRRPGIKISSERDRLLSRLLDAMQRLRAEEPRRVQSLAEFGGRETLLHGDLWPKNIIVTSKPDGRYEPRLIDWDQVSVGPVSYDLSTFLFRFPPGDRPWILELYRSALARHGWTLPPDELLAELLETAEWARLANCIIWPAKDVLAHRADWPWQELELVEQWICAAGPILPIARQA